LTVSTERFLFVSRYTCVCGGPVMIVPHVANDLDALLVVRRHEQSVQHRDYRAQIEGDIGYYDHPETPLVPSTVEPPVSIEKPSVGPDGEPGVTTRGVGTRPQHSGGVSTSPSWSLEDELYPGIRRS